jgi:hypothetical protein
VAGCFELSNEPSGLVKCEEFVFDSLRTVSFSSSEPTVLRGFS